MSCSMLPLFLLVYADELDACTDDVKTCRRCQYTHHFGGYSKRRSKKLFTAAEWHASVVSLLESGE